MNQYTERRYVFVVVIILVGLIFVSRLFYIQVIDKSYEAYAQSNSQSVTVVYPARGLIYDRNGELIVFNQAAYDIMVTPGMLTAFDTTNLEEILGLVKAHAAQAGSCCVAKLYAPSIDEAFKIAKSTLND